MWASKNFENWSQSTVEMHLKCGGTVTTVGSLVTIPHRTFPRGSIPLRRGAETFGAVRHP